MARSVSSLTYLVLTSKVVLEKLGLIFSRNAASLVNHLNLHSNFIADDSFDLKFNLDFGCFFRELNRVRQQVNHDLLDSHLIDVAEVGLEVCDEF